MITQEAEMTIDLSEQGATAVKHPRDFEMLPCRYGGMILPNVAAETSFLMLAEASFQGPFEFQLELEDLNSQNPKQSSPWTVCHPYSVALSHLCLAGPQTCSSRAAFSSIRQL